MFDVRIKRVYEEKSAEDGFRILVDKLWPRGMKKEKLPYDLWAKEITPSDEIRRQFGHLPENFPWFRQVYREELSLNPASADFLNLIRQRLNTENVSLLYAAKHPDYNHAAILKEWILERI